jgi:DNA primase
VVSSGIDVQALKNRVDLVDLAGQQVRLKKVATTRGGEFAGPCPFCGGRDRFRVQPETGLWFCRQCSPPGRWQDAIAFVQKRDGCSFAEACSILGASPSELGESVRPVRPRHNAPQLAADLVPPSAWRARAVEFVEACVAALWTDVGDRARLYLAGRGFSQETLRVWRIGFQPDEDCFASAPQWGLDGQRVWLPRGIVIPWFMGEDIWQIKVRTNGRDPKERYKAVRGGHPLLYGADTLVPGGPAVMCEGELDTLLVWQAVYDRTATVSLGSASRWPTRYGALLLAQAMPLLLGYDADVEGDKGAERLRQLAPRARRIRPPVGKDIGEFVESGGRVKAWITYELARSAAGIGTDS